MRRKNILLIRNVNPDYYGGGETYQLKLAEQLKKYDFCPYVVTSSKKLLNRGKELNFDVVEAPYNMRQNWSGLRNLLLPKYVWWQVKLERWYEELFKKLKPVAVNIQSRDDFIAATIAAKKFDIKVIWTDHMDFRSWVMENVEVKYKNIIGKWILECAKEADKVIMISDYEKAHFDKITKLNNVVVIKNGVEDSYPKYKKIVAARDSFCYVGRIVDYKGIRELLKAFETVQKKYPDATLNIYGDGEIQRFREMAGGGVIFHGVTNEPLRVIAENEIFVLPSYREGLSLSLLDAAMMKKKIIASDVDGNPEVIQDGENGILVPAKNVDKLAEAMLWMLENPKKADELTKNARKYYKQNFDFDKIFAEKMLPLYNEEKEKK